MSFLETLSQFAGYTQSVGHILSGASQAEHGKAVKQANQFQADQLRQQGNNEMGAAQRAAFFEDRKAKYIASAALASAAASGGGASDPTVVNLIAEIASEGAYRAQVALYQGQDKARTMEMSAQAREYEGEAAEAQGQAARNVSFLKATSNLLTSNEKDASIRKRFGGNGPKLTDGEY